MAFSCLVVVVVGIDVTAAPHNVVQIESLTWLTVIWFTFSPVHTLRAAIRVESVSWVKSSWAETATSRTSTLKQMIRRHNELGEYIVAINLNACKKSFSFFFFCEFVHQRSEWVCHLDHTWNRMHVYTPFFLARSVFSSRCQLVHVIVQTVTQSVLRIL